MRYIVFIGLLAILLLLVAACGDVRSTSSPSATEESTDPSASTPATGRPNVSQSPSVDMELAGEEATWVLESLDGRPVLEGSEVTLRIGDSWIDGIDGCNSYIGHSEEGTPVAGADGVFSIPPFGSTEMLCPEPEGVMDQAYAYIEALVQGERFRITDDRLEVLDSSGVTKLIFVRRAPLPGTPVDLKGSAWRLINEGDAMVGARAPTLAFLDHRLVTGATACRRYVATYQASEGAVRFPGKGMLGSPQSWQSCAENERTLEGEFTDFLSWAREYSIDKEGGSSRLRIWSIRGKTLTFEPLPQAVEDISDTEWSLMAFVELRLDSGMWWHRRTEVVQGTEVTIGFDDHGIGGVMGCNSYGGTAMVEDGTVTVDRRSFFSTAKLCEEPDGLMEQEERYFSLVQQAMRYGIYGDSLVMQADDDVFLLFQARSRTPTAALEPTTAQQAGFWRGLVVTPEERCSPYDSDDYPYSQSVERRIVADMGGIVYGPYTGMWFDSTSETDIEHIVARSEAHDSGLCAADAATRRRFASDLINLTLASPSVNRHQKSGKDAAEWLPELNQCWFANRVVEVRRGYGLTIDEHERDTLENILSGCTSTDMIVQEAPAPTPTPAAAQGDGAGNNALELYDDNGNGRITCAEARNHGIAPVRRGHPAYEYMNDADNDGVVCE